MNRYAELRQRQQKEFANFPMQFAFSDKQLTEGMEKLSLEPADTDKVYKAPGGGFYRREDSQRLKEMFERFDRELEAAVASDKTGDGFIYEMFLCELEDHEYSYTGEIEDALDALGYTLADICADERLFNGLQKQGGQPWGDSLDAAGQPPFAAYRDIGILRKAVGSE